MQLAVNGMKLFTVVIYEFFVISRSVLTGNHFQRSLIFVSKSRKYSSEALFRCSTLGLAPNLTHRQ